MGEAGTRTRAGSPRAALMLCRIGRAPIRRQKRCVRRSVIDAVRDAVPAHARPSMRASMIGRVKFLSFDDRDAAHDGACFGPKPNQIDARRDDAPTVVAQIPAQLVSAGGGPAALDRADAPPAQIERLDRGIRVVIGPELGPKIVASLAPVDGFHVTSDALKSASVTIA